MTKSNFIACVKLCWKARLMMKTSIFLQHPDDNGILFI